MSARTFVWAAMLVAPSLAGCERVQAQTAAGPSEQCAANPTSSWASAGGVYARSTAYGTGVVDFLQSVTGLARLRSGVAVFDLGSARVHVLDSELRTVSGFGREGDGPGEFRRRVDLQDRQRYPRRNVLSGDDSVLAVFSARSVHMFDLDGGFLRSQVVPFQQEFVGEWRYLHVYGGALYAGLYVSHPAPSFERSFSVVRLTESGPERVYELSLARLPLVGNRAYEGPQEARPVFAGFGQCLLLGDGSSSELVLLDLSNMRARTVKLPEVGVEDLQLPVPPPMQAFVGGNSRYGPPAALLRWTQVSVDPDGHLWVEVWRHDTAAPPQILRVDPNGGVHVEDVPAFPRIFGASGVFYSSERLPVSDEMVITRYQRARR